MNFEFKNAVKSDDDILIVDPPTLLNHLKNVKIVDVRTPEEFEGELGHIEGAQLIPLQGFAEDIEKLDKNDTYVFVCRSGGRSTQAAMYAQAQGFQRVYNMLGGMILWNRLGFKVDFK